MCLLRGDGVHPSTHPPVSTTSNDKIWEGNEDDYESAKIIPDTKDAIDSRGSHLNQQPAYDKLINAEFQLHHDNKIRYGNFKKQALNPDYQTTGIYDENPMLNSIIYEVKFEDVHVK